MGTHFFLSLSHHSCLFFWLLPCRSSSMNGDPQASPLLLRTEGGMESGEGGSPKSWTTKDRCRPRYERLIMVLTDKLLSETVDEAQCLPQSLPLHSSSGRLAQANCYGVVVPCHLQCACSKKREEK